MPLYLMEAPDLDGVLPLADAKNHLRVEHDDDDTLITGMIAAVVQNLDGRDGWLGRALAEQTWELRLPGFCGPEITIPLPPLIEVESVTYHDAAEALQTLSTDDYEVVGAGGSARARVVLRHGRRWPAVGRRTEAVVVRFRAGYGSEAAPPPVKQAVRMLLADLYEGSRGDGVVASETVTGVGSVTYRSGAPRSSAVARLLAPLRVW
jgi:uncharacterized phiE125 gp8 family phage protein